MANKRNAKIYLRKAISFLLTILLIFSLSFTAFCTENTDDNGGTLFGYHSRVANEGGNETVFGYIMWGVFFVFVALLIIAAVFNFLRLKKEEKASGKASKPKLIIKKGYKN